MTQRIYRYPLQITDYQEVKVTTGRILAVAPGRSPAPVAHIDLWAVHDDEDGIDLTLGVYIAGTGHDLHPNVQNSTTSYLGTCVMPDRLVFHVFYQLT